MPNNTNENNKCRLHQFEKNHYFYGKLMTVRDFETEQSYFDEKNHFINRLLHGSGLVCGFEELQIEDKGDKITIDFTDGGMALDCCGREIVVPGNTLGRPIVDSMGNSVPDLTANPYLYLKYKPCYNGYVAAASNPSSCEEKCCPGRIVEDFEVVASDIEPDLKSISCRVEPAEEPDGTIGVREWLERLEEAHIICPACGENEEYKVFLGKVEAGEDGFKVNTWDTEKYRIFFTQKELYQLLKCHILDLENPHEVTAEQIGALVSVDGVIGNQSGNVDLVKRDAIVIIDNHQTSSITIGETHSARTDNPHQVTAKQTGALISVNNVGGDPNGNIKLTPGTNITITPKPADFAIEIASTGGGASPGENVKSVSTSINPGSSDKYSREDHVHDLEKGIVDFEKLSEKLQDQLNLLFKYLRERALKCTVNSFENVRFENDISFEIIDETRKAVNERVYEKETNFIPFMEHLLQLMAEYAGNLTPGVDGGVTRESLINFQNSLEELKIAIESGDPIRIAIQQDEVCYYVLQLQVFIG